MFRADVRRARHLADDIHDLVRELLQFKCVGTKNFDRQFAFHAGDGFVHVVLDVLAELRVNAGNFREFARHRVAQRLAVVRGGPALARNQADAVFRGVPAVHVAAVVGHAFLVHDVAHFGKRRQHQPDLVRELGRFRRRNGLRQKRAHPQIAFVQLRQKFRADEMKNRRRQSPAARLRRRKSTGAISARNPAPGGKCSTASARSTIRARQFFRL